MAITVGAHTIASSSGGQTVTTSGIDSTGASLLVVLLVTYSLSTQPTLSDSKGNTWTALTSRTVGALEKETLYYCNPTSVGSGHTFSTSSVVNSFPMIAVACFNGTATSSVFDQESGSTAVATSIQPGAITPTADNYLLVTGVGLGSVSAGFTIDGGFTKTDQAAFSGGNAFGGGMAYLIQTSAASANPTWDFGGSTISVAVGMASFKVPASGGGPFPHFTNRRMRGGFIGMNGGL